MCLTHCGRPLIAGLFVSLALVACPSALSADHAWGTYHWARTSNPFPVPLGDNLSALWAAYLETTAADWSWATVLDTTVVDGQTSPRSCRPTSGRVEVCNDHYGRTGWLGVAQVWVRGSHITQATVQVNDTYFATAPYNDPAWRALVLCQEVGHTLGLDHQDDAFENPPLGTCMDYSSEPEPNQSPNAHDDEELETIYAHLDGTTTVGSPAAASLLPPARASLDLSTPAQWGRLLRRSRDRRTALYERDLGRGHRVFTFVIWAA
jgi:hypothetical protein